jgi:hypothetical protein
MTSRRPVLSLLGLLLLAGCGLQPIEVRHGPVAGFTPAAVPSAPPVAVEARETQPADRIRYGTSFNGSPVDRRIGFPVSNDLATELREALAAALRQRGLQVAAAEAAVLRLDLAIEEADAVARTVQTGPPSIQMVSTGPRSFMTVPVTPMETTTRTTIAVQAVLSDRAGATRFSRRYEHAVTRVQGMTELNTTVTRAGMEECLRSVVRQIAEDPDLIRAIAAAR